MSPLSKICHVSTHTPGTAMESPGSDTRCTNSRCMSSLIGYPGFLRLVSALLRRRNTLQQDNNLHSLHTIPPMALLVQHRSWNSLCDAMGAKAERMSCPRWTKNRSRGKTISPRAVRSQKRNAYQVPGTLQIICMVQNMINSCHI